MSERDDVRVVFAEFESGAPTVEGLPEGGPAEVAFVGKSNVGKSSLINALVERRNLVRTSSTPGCTRQLNVFGARLSSGRELRLVDLPGYGYAKLSKTERASWGAKLEGYVRGRAALRCVVLILDARRGLSADDSQMVEFLRAPRPAGPPPELVLVATKLDKIEKSKRGPALVALARQAGGPVVGFSAHTAEGRPALWARIQGALGATSLASTDGVG